MFERFNDRARRVLVLAQEEARLLNHNFIGTEHILLGLVHEGEGVASQALRAVGISLESVRDQVVDMVGPAPNLPAGAPPFTPRAKKVLELSLREALQLNHNYIGTEHMLLGLIREGEGVASQVMASLAGSLDRVREEVERLLAIGARDGPARAGAEGATTAWRGIRTPPVPHEAPVCPGCRGALADTLRWSTQAVPPHGDKQDEVLYLGDKQNEVLHVVLWWCRACGRTLSVSPAEPAPGEAGPARPVPRPQPDAPPLDTDTAAAARQAGLLALKEEILRKGEESPAAD